MKTRSANVIEAEYREALLGMNSLYEKLLDAQVTVGGTALDGLKERIKLREADVLSLARELRAMSKPH